MEKKNMHIVVILLVVVIALVVVFGFFGIGGLNFFPAPHSPAQAPQTSQAPDSVQALLARIQQNGGKVSDLQVADVVVGTGEALAPGDAIDVEYTGLLPNGTVFDSTAAHGGAPLSLVVAQDGSLRTPDGGGLIPGWSQGFAGMRNGGRRLLAIPPSLGYGANAVGTIPANSTLIFDVRIVKLTPRGATAPAAPAR